MPDLVNEQMRLNLASIARKAVDMDFPYAGDLVCHIDSHLVDKAVDRDPDKRFAVVEKK